MPWYLDEWGRPYEVPDNPTMEPDNVPSWMSTPTPDNVPMNLGYGEEPYPVANPGNGGVFAPGGALAGKPAAGGGASNPWGVDQSWWDAFKAEHGGIDPDTYFKGNKNQGMAEKSASEAWAGLHGSPMSWGNAPGNNRVPYEIFKRLATGTRDKVIGPQGGEAVANAADDIGGAILAMSGRGYHPTSATAAGTSPIAQSLWAALLGGK